LRRIDFFEVAPHEIEVLAVVGAVFFIHRLGTALAALMCHDDIEMHAITAAPEISFAAFTLVSPTRRVG